MAVDIEGEPPNETLQVSYDGIPVASVPGRVRPEKLVAWIPPVLLEDSADREECLCLLRQVDEHLGRYHHALRESPAVMERLSPDTLRVLRTMREEFAALLLSAPLTPLLREHMRKFTVLLREGR